MTVPPWDGAVPMPPTEYEGEISPTEYEPGAAPARPAAVSAQPAALAATDYEPGADPDLAQEPRGDTDLLPEALRGRYELTSILRQPADELRLNPAVYRVRDEAGRDLVLKWYDRRRAPLETVRAALREPVDDAVLRIEDGGDVRGHPYDVTPVCGETTLAAYLAERRGRVPASTVRAVVERLHRALTKIHDMGMVHRDVCPANIVVSSYDRDDLGVVLIDFDLAHFHTGDYLAEPEEWAGTLAYLPPEAALVRRQLIQPAADWWALGVISAEMALGRHPQWRSDRDIFLLNLAAREPELDGIEDAAIRQLCGGLLFRNDELRWGSAEVGLWLRGEGPTVGPHRLAGAFAPPVFDDTAWLAGIEPFPYQGRQYRSPRILADAFEAGWAPMRELLDQTAARRQFVAWLTQFREAPDRNLADVAELEALCALLSDRPPDPVALVRLLNWLSSYERDAAYRETPLDLESLAMLVDQAREGGNRLAASICRDLREFDVLSELSRCRRGAGLDEVMPAWRQILARWEEAEQRLLGQFEHLRRDRAVRRGVRAAALRSDESLQLDLLAFAIAPRSWLASRRRQIRALLNSLPEPVDWFGWIASQHNDPLMLLLAVRLYPHASAEATHRHRRIQDQLAHRELALFHRAVAAWLRRHELLPTLSWAVAGAMLLIVPWLIVIDLSDVLNWATQSDVLIAWLEAVPAALVVTALELALAIRVGSPFYHPHYSLLGTVVPRAEPLARLVLRPGARHRVYGALGIAAGVAVLWVALLVAPWLWPMATTTGLAWWTVRRWVRWNATPEGQYHRGNPLPLQQTLLAERPPTAAGAPDTGGP